MHSDGNGLGFGLTMMVIMLVMYFLPGIYASIRKHKNREAIWLTNFLLGWTIIGWIMAAIWASTNNRETA
jgi:4-amino-4-deoxy-L-arabinose transferase-like glycosyltransferase